MKRNIETSILIHAPAEAVWTVLSDFSQYGLWSPTIRKFGNIPQVGKRTKVLLQQPNGSSITMNPIFLKLDKDRELRWKGKLFINGVFDGEHYFILEDLDNGQTRLVQGELFSGLLIPFLKKMIDVETKKGFQLFNEALKLRVEKKMGLLEPKL
ncbi:SRPBCC domain-containing protein [Sphingobacterium faecale]|uniref:SRPBCC domain-containing protein n=1 Tax=Sphingobacterium faecale TaxID=2803775 RepID=A0ABS1QZK5_9SPHI|nr:SRPBCC domain-containing protein [Sphingobacterium faecale]MBL1407858.1 SRPBCC domain-containing protein [Sphingobacterium faecale]